MLNATNLKSATGAVLGLALAALGAGAALAQGNPFAPGWVLDGEASSLRFQSIKNETKVESSSFATFTGLIDDQGRATVRILLDSVDTKVDLRNVRMRFLMFQTFLYPEAIVTLDITPDMIADLSRVRRKTVVAPYALSMHGVTKESEAELAVTLLSDNIVSVASAAPISIPVADFGMEEGVRKLEEAANVKIVPSATVTFDFMFSRDDGGEDLRVASLDTPVVPGAAALEVEGDFSDEACRGRFEIMSRTEAINFATSSARLRADSLPLLDSIYDIVSRCPGLNIQIAGHTDSDGSAVLNQRLSEQRAAVVREYLLRKGIQGGRIVAVGYGETRPVADNATREGKRRNRRIEFAPL